MISMCFITYGLKSPVAVLMNRLLQLSFTRGICMPSKGTTMDPMHLDEARNSKLVAEGVTMY